MVYMICVENVWVWYFDLDNDNRYCLSGGSYSDGLFNCDFSLKKFKAG